MDGNQHLHWVRQNRARKHRDQRIAGPVTRLVQGVVLPAAQGIGELAERLAPLVDDGFREHCRVSLADRRTLRVNVTDAALAYSMRGRWLAKLRSALAEPGSGPRISRIVFAFGTEGFRVPPPGAGGSHTGGGERPSGAGWGHHGRHPGADRE
jgi:hypothetical protein